MVFEASRDYPFVEARQVMTGIADQFGLPCTSLREFLERDDNNDSGFL